MNDSKKNIPYKLCGGFKIPHKGNKQFFNNAIHYKPKFDDIFLVSYPKCGTTLIQHITYLILNKGKPSKRHTEVISTIPFPEQDGFPKHEQILAFKYHLPPHLMPMSSQSKYICVTRNPLDSCVSYYHFLKDLPAYNIQSFNDFFEAFIMGELPYGDYFDHLIPWFEISKNRDNVLFITYEYLKEEHREAVVEIAKFLNCQDVIADDEILNDIVRYSSLEYMRSIVDGDDLLSSYLHITSMGVEKDNIDECISNTTLHSHNTAGKDNNNFKKSVPRFIRKGVVGDWKNYFSSEQSIRMKRKFTEKTADVPGLQNLWSDLFKDIV